jgi:hypothetical protein
MPTIGTCIVLYSMQIIRNFSITIKRTFVDKVQKFHKKVFLDYLYFCLHISALDGMSSYHLDVKLNRRIYTYVYICLFY